MINIIDCNFIPILFYNFINVIVIQRLITLVINNFIFKYQYLKFIINVSPVLINHIIIDIIITQILINDFITIISFVPTKKTKFLKILIIPVLINRSFMIFIFIPILKNSPTINGIPNVINPFIHNIIVTPVLIILFI